MTAYPEVTGLLKWIPVIALPTLAAIACGGPKFEAGPLGAVTVPPGEAIQICAMLEDDIIAGPGSPDQRAVDMALADYGPIHGRSVSKGTSLDSKCTADGGQAAAETAAGDPQVVGAIGTSCSVAAAAAALIISEAGMVMIAPSTTAPSLTSELKGKAGSNYRPGFYRTSNNDLYQAQAVARFVYDDLGLRRMAAIHDGDPYTSGLASAFANAFETLGGSVVATAEISRGDTEMVPALTQIAAERPDGIFFPVFWAEGAHIVRQIPGIAGLKNVTRIGGGALLSPPFLNVPESEGMYLNGPDVSKGNNVNEATGRSGDSLIETYEQQYGEESTSAYLAHTYDAATLLLRAIEQTAVAGGDTLYIDRAGLREKLTGVTGFQGITGTLSCDEFGDCGSGGVVIYHHTDSGLADLSDLPIVYRSAP